MPQSAKHDEYSSFSTCESPKVRLMICSSQTERLVNHCFTTSTTRTNLTDRAKRNMPLYGSYQFVYIGQPSLLSSGACSEHHGHIENPLDMKSDSIMLTSFPSVRPSILPTIRKGCTNAFRHNFERSVTPNCCFCLKGVSVLLVKMDTNQYGSPSRPRSKTGFQRATHSSRLYRCMA